MTVFLTPEGDPFYSGTYFPRDHFLQVLTALDEAWRTRQDEVRQSGRHIATALTDALVPPPPAVVDAAALDRAVATLASQFDSRAGGFGRAPKFPPSMVLEFLLRHTARTGDDLSARMAERTLEAMARSGMYDQLAGGFARYSVDAEWVVPHFEKMLYDNALLLRAYTTWWRATGSPLARGVVQEVADFTMRDLGTATGGFASSLDADAAGVEGLTYAWTPAQARRGARGGRRCACGRGLRRDRAGHVRARRVDAAAAQGPRRHARRRHERCRMAHLGASAPAGVAREPTPSRPVTTRS